MKVNFIKKFLILCCTVIAVASLGVAFGFYGTARADGAGEFYAESVADVRLSDPMGLRFTVRFDETVKNDVVNNGKTLGIIAVPNSYVEQYNDYTNDNPAYAGGYFGYFRDIKGKILYATFTESEFGQDATSYFARLAITGIKFNNLNLDFAVIGFIAPANGDLAGYRYTDASAAKNIGALANAAIDSGEDFGTEANAYLNEIKTQAALNADGVAFNAETAKYEFNVNVFDDLAEITTRASYTVRHVKIVNGAEQEITSDTVENALVGSTVNTVYNNPTGCLPIDNASTLSATVAANGSTVLKAVYSTAIPVKINNSGDSVAAFYPYGSGNYGDENASIDYQSNGDYAGSYKVSVSQGNNVFRVIGVDKAYATAHGISKLSFKVYMPDKVRNTVGFVINSEDQRTFNASMQTYGEVNVAQDYLRLYSDEGCGLLSLEQDRWITVEIDLSTVCQNEGMIDACVIFNSGETENLNEVFYIKDVSLSTETVNAGFIPIVGTDGFLAPISNQGRVGGNEYSSSDKNKVTVNAGVSAGGEDNAYELMFAANGNSSSYPLRIYGLTPAEVANKQLVFDVYYETNAQLSLFVGADGSFANTKAGATIDNNGELRTINAADNFKLYNGDNQVNLYAKYNWYTAAIKLDGTVAFDNCPVDNVDIRIRGNAGETFYIANVRLEDITTYAIQYKKVDGVTETLDSTEHSFGLAGKNVDLALLGIDFYKPIAGYMPKTDICTLSGTVSNSLVLTVKYVPATQIEFGGENVATLFPFNNGSNAFGAGVTTEKITDGDFSGAIKHTISSQYYLNLLGQNKNYLTENGIQKLTFDIYAATLPNIVVYIQGGTAASMDNRGNMTANNNRKYLRVYDENGCNSNVISSGKWFTVEVNLADVRLDSGFARIDDMKLRIDTSASNSPVYIRNARFSAESIDKYSIAIGGSENKAVLTPIDEWGFIGAGNYNSNNYNNVQITKAETAVAGNENTYKVYFNNAGNTATQNNVFLRIYGVDKAYLTTNGIKTLTFKIYVDPASGSSPTLFMGTTGTGNVSGTGATTTTSGDMSGKTAFYKILNADGTAAANNTVVAGAWYTVKINLAYNDYVNVNDFTSTANLPMTNFPVVNFKLRLNVGSYMYLSDVQFDTAEW